MVFIFTRLEVASCFKATPKFSAFGGIYFLPQPLFVEYFPSSRFDRAAYAE